MLDILLVFIALKWTGAVDWSWGIVFIPAWISLIEVVAGLLWAWWSELDL